MAKSPLDALNKFNDKLEKRLLTKIELKGFADISEYIPTGNYLLNAQMSGSLFGGYPNTRSISISGDPSCLHKTQKLRIYKIKNPKYAKSDRIVSREN
jgi:hypothetical protein